ncbi:hypothetical protein [Bdellovibrio bacteriovorus]|uniref:hypothetical protein n=1 Tax=Bdellovibrio bacteriovorus TaxID=959 RepID=UPI0035A70A90
MSALLAVLFPVFAFAQNITSGTLYDLKSNQTKKLYTVHIAIQPAEDGVHTEATYKDLNGAMVVQEKGVLKGAQVLRYEMNRPQTQEKGSFSVVDGKIHFEYEGPGGKKKSAEEKVKGTVLSTANFNAFVTENWNDLSSGKALDVRFAVWDRLETVGFTLEKRGETEHKGEKWMELRMKPTSFVIAALVDPIYLWYSTADKRLTMMKGRVSPKIMKDGKWKDLDAEVVYTYGQN